MFTSESRRYSSTVALQLIAHGESYLLAQVAPDFVVLKSPSQLPPGPATIVMVVDGEERRWDVVLTGTEGPAEIVSARAACNP